MKKKKISIINHYRKLWFYTFNRYKRNNYLLMREYFSKILIYELEEFILLWNKKVIDVGGGRGEFCKNLNKKRKCDTINLDPNPNQMNSNSKSIWSKTICGYADAIPFGNNEFDLVICRGVLEHIPMEKQEDSINEMYRVTKVGGICYITIPPWYNPHAGHQLKPFHIFPFKLAKYLREMIFKNKINASSFEEFKLFKITFKKMIEMASLSGFKVVATKDTHFRMHFLTKIPIIREIMVPAVSFILIKMSE